MVNRNVDLCDSFSLPILPDSSVALLRILLTLKTYVINFSMKLQDFDFKYLELNNKVLLNLTKILQNLTKIKLDYIINTVPDENKPVKEPDNSPQAEPSPYDVFGYI